MYNEGADEMTKAGDRPRFIYAMVDPREPRKVRYIGCTLDLRHRLKGHLWDTLHPHDLMNIPHFFFVLYCLLDGFDPEMVVLDVVPPGKYWPPVERRWIERFRARGSDLTNIEATPLDERGIPCEGDCAGVERFPVDGRCPVCHVPMRWATLEERNARRKRELGVEPNPSGAAYFKRFG
jgi:hypothetical protein